MLDYEKFTFDSDFRNSLSDEEFKKYFPPEAQERYDILYVKPRQEKNNRIIRKLETRIEELNVIINM